MAPTRLTATHHPRDATGDGDGTGAGFSAPHMDRICEIGVIYDVVADVDALSAARAHGAVSGPERRTTQRISSTMARTLGA
jgi:hypothetical protein